MTINKLHNKFHWRIALLFLLVLLLVNVPGEQALAKTNGKKVEKQYDIAKAYYNNLQFSHKLADDRQNWQYCRSYFKNSYAADPYHKLAPASLLSLGSISHQMYKLFGHKDDLADALAFYDDLVSFFPAHSFADDALYNTGKIMVFEQNEYQDAALVFAKLLAIYPSGDMVNNAARNLKIAKKKAAVYAAASTQLNHNSPKPIEIAPAKPAKVPAGEKAQVVNLRHWSTKNYTRIVVETSGPVDFKENLLQGGDNKERRLYVNLYNCLINPKLQNAIPINDGLLKRVRSAQFSGDTVRVVMDTQSLADYNIFSLNDPFRIVIDVKGEVSQKTPKKPIISLPNTPSLAQQLGLGINKIIIDPGHGGKDPGAIGVNGLREKDIVLKVAKLVARKLDKEIGGNAILTRNRDVYLRLEERTAIANTKEGDLFISIHANSAPNKKASGIETYFLSMAGSKEEMRVAALENMASGRKISDLQQILKIMQDSKLEESSKLANIVQKNLVTGLTSKYAKIGNYGVKKAPFVVLIGAQMPAILTEIAFLSNKEDAARLTSDSYLNDLADQIAAGIVEYTKVLNMASLE